MSRLDKLKTEIKIDKLQDLEKDLLYFYDYLIFLKETKREDCWLKYAGVYRIAKKIILVYGLPEYSKSRYFTEKNMIAKYVMLCKKFKLSDFENNVFDLLDVKLYSNQWRMK